MGRGRAKAKQTKVARELKYSSGALDINALTAELSSSGHEPGPDRGSSRSGADDTYGDDDAYDPEPPRR
jgi:hypothetical protein